MSGWTDLVPLRATIGVPHVATPARWLDDALLCSCVFNLRQHQSAAAAPRTVLEGGRELWKAIEGSGGVRGVLEERGERKKRRAEER